MADAIVSRIYERWLRRPGALKFPHAEIRAAIAARTSIKRSREVRPDEECVRQECRLGMAGFRGYVRRDGRMRWTKLYPGRDEAQRQLEMLVASIDGKRAGEVGAAA